MKKTVTTILSLALAMILVSSLSSGVILAKGDDDHDNRKKNKNKYETVIDVVIVSCVDAGLFMPGPGFGATFINFDSTIVDPMLPEAPLGSCAINLAFLLKEGFKIQDVGATLLGGAHYSSYMTVRKKRVRND